MTTEGKQILEQFKNMGSLTLEANKECWSKLLFEDGSYKHKGGARDFNEQDFDLILSEDQALDLIKKKFIEIARRWEKIEIGTDKEVPDCWDRWPHNS